MKQCFIIFLLLLPFGLQAADLNEQVKTLVIDKVKEYCTLMSRFAGDMENIEDMDRIVALCENNKVSTYDDFEQGKFVCRPLFDYLQNITLTYENNLQLDYTQFQYQGMFSAPSVANIPGDNYAKILVSKRMRGKGMDRQVRNVITVNISTMKIGGTTEENFKDPYGIYIEAIEAMKNGELTKAEDLFRQVSSVDFFSYRYRAQSYLGQVLFQQKKMDEGYNTLLAVGQNDPLAEILLSVLYYKGSIEYKNLAEAFRLLERNAQFEDKDFPEISRVAKLQLASLYSGYTPNPDVTPRPEEAIRMLNELLADETNKGLEICENMLLGDVLAQQSNDDHASLPYLQKYNIFELDLNLPEDAFQDLEIIRCNLYAKVDTTAYEAEIICLEQSYLYYGWACRLVGTYYYERANYAQAHSFWLKGANLGDADSANKLAGLYESGQGVVQSKQEALKWEMKAAEYGSKDALYFLGVSYNWGNQQYGISADVAKAISYLEKAALLGVDNAALILGNIYLFGDSDISKDEAEALRWFRLAADSGNAEACLYVGYIYADGSQVPHDFVAALRWYKACVDHGDCTEGGVAGVVGNVNAGIASSNIAEFYDELEDDYSLPKDNEEALRWYRISLNNGNKAANYYIARFYENGIVVSRDLKEAFDLYQQVSDVSQSACMKLGEYYENGKVVSADADVALHWYAQSLLQSNWYEVLNDSLKADVRACVNRLVTQKRARDMMGELLAAASQEVDPLTRIEIADRLISTYFASEKAVIQVVGSNNQTVVATETVRNYMDAVCTGLTIDSFSIPADSVQKNAQGKITAMKIREIRDADNS